MEKIKLVPCELCPIHTDELPCPVFLGTRPGTVAWGVGAGDMVLSGQRRIQNRGGPM